MFEKARHATYIASQICFDSRVTVAWIDNVWARGHAPADPRRDPRHRPAGEAHARVDEDRDRRVAPLPAQARRLRDPVPAARRLQPGQADQGPRARARRPRARRSPASTSSPSTTSPTPRPGGSGSSPAAEPCVDSTQIAAQRAVLQRPHEAHRVESTRAPRVSALRRRDRRRRLGRLRAREPPQRRPLDQRARARGRPPRLQVGRLHPHAGRARDADRQPLLRLEVRVGARAAHERAPDLPRARQGARRLLEHQRDDLPARQPARLRALGRRRRDGRLGLRPLPPVLQADGELPRRRRRVPRRRRPARARARPRHEPALPGVLRGRAAGRLPAHRRRQRLPAGGLRRLRPQHPPRPPAQRRARVPPPRHAPAEPRRPLPRVRQSRGVRRHARRRRRGGGPGRAGADRGRRGDPLRRRDQLAAAPPALRRRQRRRARGARDRRRPRPPRRRRAPAGPPRGLHPVRLEAAGLGRARR